MDKNYVLDKNYVSTKTYGNERGFSCAFRQWKADSHCNLIHGYSLGFRFEFEAKTLDDRNWVYDFGNCKWIKEFLEHTFDHTYAAADDDPHLDKLRELNELNIIDLRILKDGVGCEKFAEYVFDYVSPKVAGSTNHRVRLRSVEVFEHGSNSAIVEI